MHRRRRSDNEPSITITFHNMEKLMTKKWLDDSLALVALIHTGNASDPAVKAAVDNLSKRLDTNDASDAEVKAVVDAVLKKLAESQPASGAAAILTSISPSSGSSLGGETLTLSGTGFTGATGVKLGDATGLNFTVVDDSTITVVSPAQAVATVPVSVINAAGNSAPGVTFTLS